MCWYITIMLPAGCEEHLRERVDALDASGRWRRRPEDGVGVAPVHDEAVPEQCPNDWSAVYLVRSDCSCGLFSSRGGDGNPWKTRAEEIAAKGRRRGWSEAKIERAIESSRASAPDLERFAGLRADVRQLLADLTDHVPRIGVLVQWQGKKSKPLGPAGRTISASELLADDAAVAESVVTWITRDRA